MHTRCACAAGRSGIILFLPFTWTSACELWGRDEWDREDLDWLGMEIKVYWPGPLKVLLCRGKELKEKGEEW